MAFCWLCLFCTWIQHNRCIANTVLLLWDGHIWTSKGSDARRQVDGRIQHLFCPIPAHYQCASRPHSNHWSSPLYELGASCLKSCSPVLACLASEIRVEGPALWQIIDKRLGQWMETTGPHSCGTPQRDLYRDPTLEIFRRKLNMFFNLAKWSCFCDSL